MTLTYLNRPGPEAGCLSMNIEAKILKKSNHSSMVMWRPLEGGWLCFRASGGGVVEGASEVRSTYSPAQIFAFNLGDSVAPKFSVAGRKEGRSLASGLDKWEN